VIQVVADLVEQHRDMAVVQAIEDRPPVPARRHEPQVTQDAKLLRGRRRGHSRALGKLGDAGLALAQRVQQPYARRRGERLHELGDGDRLGLGHRTLGPEMGVLRGVGHDASLYPRTYADERFGELESASACQYTGIGEHGAAALLDRLLGDIVVHQQPVVSTRRQAATCSAFSASSARPSSSNCVTRSSATR
jgi:hypothetical protein